MNKLDTQEYYELMQEYRHAPLEDQYLVSEKFNNIGLWIKRNFKEIKDNRSNQMNRYYWAVPVAIWVGELGWDKDDVHDYFKERYLSSCKYIKGIKVTKIGSTKALNNAEFIDFCKNIQRDSSVEHDLYIPDPNEADYDKIYQMYKKD